MIYIQQIQRLLLFFSSVSNFFLQPQSIYMVDLFQVEDFLFRSDH